MLDKLCRQTVLRLKQHQSIVHLLPFLGSQPSHKLAKISAKCHNPPLHAANIQRVPISCNPIDKIFHTFTFCNSMLQSELRSPPDVNREGSICLQAIDFSPACSRIHPRHICQRTQKQMRTESIYMDQTPRTSPDAETPKVYSLPSLRTEMPNTSGVYNSTNGQDGFQPSISEFERKRESGSRLHSVCHPDVIY